MHFLKFSLKAKKKTPKFLAMVMHLLASASTLATSKAITSLFAYTSIEVLRKSLTSFSIISFVKLITDECPPTSFFKALGKSFKLHPGYKQYVDIFVYHNSHQVSINFVGDLIWLQAFNISEKY